MAASTATTKTPSTAQVMKDAATGVLTAVELDAWLDKNFPNNDFLKGVFVETSLLPVLTSARASHAPVTEPGVLIVDKDKIAIHMPGGGVRVYPLNGVIEPTLLEKLKGVPVIGEIISTGEFLSKLAEFVLNPVRMGELFVGAILITIGVRAALGGSLGGTAKATTKTAVSPIGKFAKYSSNINS